MKTSDDDIIAPLSDEKIINIPSTAVGDEQAAELSERIMEIAEDSLSEDNPDFHELPLYMNARLQRDRDKDKHDKEESNRITGEVEEVRLHKRQKEYETVMAKLMIRFEDIAKRAYRWSLALFTREMEIRDRAIVLDDGRRVYVNGDGFVDEKGQQLTDTNAIAEAHEKKKTDSATAHELQVADHAHALAEQERTIEHEASHGASDTDNSKRAAPLMKPEERTVAAAGAGSHAGELERTQSATEQQARELLNSNTASHAADAGLPAVAHSAPPSAASPVPEKNQETPTSASSDIITGLRNAFASALDSTTVRSTGTTDPKSEASSLKTDFSVAIAPPRNDNSTSTRDTATADSLPPVRLAPL